MPEQHRSSLPRHLAPTLRQPNSLNRSGFFLRFPCRLCGLAPASLGRRIPAKLSRLAVRRDTTSLREDGGARCRARVSKRRLSMGTSRMLAQSGPSGGAEREAERAIARREVAGRAHGALEVRGTELGYLTVRQDALVADPHAARRDPAVTPARARRAITAAGVGVGIQADLTIEAADPTTGRRALTTPGHAGLIRRAADPGAHLVSG